MLKVANPSAGNSVEVDLCWLLLMLVMKFCIIRCTCLPAHSFLIAFFFWDKKLGVPDHSVSNIFFKWSSML